MRCRSRVAVTLLARAYREHLQQSTLQHMAVIAMRGLVNLNMIMGMNAPQIADRGDPAGARISRAPAAEHAATHGRDRHAGLVDLNRIMGMNAPCPPPCPPPCGCCLLPILVACCLLLTLSHQRMPSKCTPKEYTQRVTRHATTGMLTESNTRTDGRRQHRVHQRHQTQGRLQR